MSALAVKECGLLVEPTSLVAIPALGSAHHVFLASIAAYVGLDPSRDINFVTYPAAQSMQLLAGGENRCIAELSPNPSGASG
jgi:NitT/TauT family transport system substrate-binding protein